MCVGGHTACRHMACRHMACRHMACRHMACRGGAHGMHAGVQWVCRPEERLCMHGRDVCRGCRVCMWEDMRYDPPHTSSS